MYKFLLYLIRYVISTSAQKKKGLLVDFGGGERRGVQEE